jgi:hypothetical protein
VRCASAGAERREGGLCADPAVRAILQAKRKEKKESSGGGLCVRGPCCRKERPYAPVKSQVMPPVLYLPDGDFDADHGFDFDGVGRSAH